MFYNKAIRVTNRSQQIIVCDETVELVLSLDKHIIIE